MLNIQMVLRHRKRNSKQKATQLFKGAAKTYATMYRTMKIFSLI